MSCARGTDRQLSRMRYLAGGYRKEGNRTACTVLTREPAESIAFIHNLSSAKAVSDWMNICYDALDVLKVARVEMAYHLV